MTVPTHSYDHRDYEIVVSQTPPYSQAEIYPTEPNLPQSTGSGAYPRRQRKRGVRFGEAAN